ncbi:MAG: hypothetical protein KGO96_07295 [Elusimicrobia bacterium]|nr:hypothetical protein [Elusimicrobiota bacterium]
MSKKNTIEDCDIIANKKGGWCLSIAYINASIKLKWKCKKNHIWETNYNNIRRSWCPRCEKISRRHFIEDCHRLAFLKEGKCLSNEYNNVHTKLKWQCKEGHVWESDYHSIKRNSWCPECNFNNKRNTLEDCKKIALSWNGSCLSEQYKNNHTKLKWQCQNNHIWEAIYNNIQKGEWCPYCIHRHSKAELEIYNYIKHIYSETIQGFRIPSYKLMELDIYVPSLNKAIEYDGTIFHGETAIYNKEYTINRDLKKNRIMSKSRNPTFEN